MTNEVQLLKQATYSQGRLWFRSSEDEQLYGLALKHARVIVKSIKSMLRLAKNKSTAYDFGSAVVVSDHQAHVKLLLGQPGQDAKMVAISAEWLGEMKPLIERALYILDHRPHTDDFTLVTDGPGDVSEVTVDAKSVPQN